MKDYDSASNSIEKALRELQTKYVDVMLLHAISSPEDLATREREGALDAFREAKTAGKIRVIGCSTHTYTGPVMDAVIDHPEIEVILTTANKQGRMLEGGSIDRHLEYIQRAYNVGKGISIMKVVVAGDIPEADMPEWIEWGFNLEAAHAINSRYHGLSAYYVRCRTRTCECKATFDTTQGCITSPLVKGICNPDVFLGYEATTRQTA